MADGHLCFCDILDNQSERLFQFQTRHILKLRQTILSTVNLVVFGALTRNSPGFAYDEGFWCACVPSTLRLENTVDSN